MTRIVLCILLVAISHAVLAASAAADPTTSLTERLDQRRPLVIAHRGCIEFGPENSLAALNACIQLGVDMVESDVRATKDGVLVLMHDATLDRMTNLSGAVADYTYAELKRAKLRVGAGGQNAALTEELIPRLTEVLNAARGRVFLLLHTKGSNHDQVYDLVDAASAQDRVALLVDTSPHDSALRQGRFGEEFALIAVVRQCSPARRNVHCYEEGTLGRAFQDFHALEPVAYLVASASDDRSFLEKGAAVIRKDGARVSALSSDEGRLRDPNAVWGPLLRMNVSLILTDRASELVAYLKARDLR